MIGKLLLWDESPPLLEACEDALVRADRAVRGPLNVFLHKISASGSEDNRPRAYWRVE
jgi:hypothetical protein